MSGQRIGRDRIEQEARRRRARANHHLDRVRNRRTQRVGSAARPALLLGAPLLSLLLGLWVGGDALARLGDPGWQVEAVEVLGADRLSAAEVAEAAGLSLGDDYGETEPEQLARRLAESPWIAEARAARLLGGTVVLEVREREPLAVIETRGGPLGVDAEGRPFAVLEEREAESLPRLRCADTPPPGEADPRLAEAIRVARSLPGIGLALPRRIEVSAEGDPEGLVLLLPELETRFVLGAEELDARVATLAEVLAERAEEVAAAASVDLRFAGQAVLQAKADPDGSA